MRARVIDLLYVGSLSHSIFLGQVGVWVDLNDVRQCCQTRNSEADRRGKKNS